MLLSELLTAIKPIEVIGSTDKEINGLHFDSRKIGEGDLFVAQVGTAVDGHTFIEGCVEKGASAIVLSKREYMADVQRDNVQRATRPISSWRTRTRHWGC